MSLANYYRQALIILVVATSHNALGSDIPGYPDRIEAHDAREIALLPRYCRYTLTYRNNVPGGSNPAEIARWSRIIGPTFIHMHHYCNGLMDTNRAALLATSQRVRAFYLQTSIVEFDYVIERSPPGFVLLPEILTKKGENLLRLGGEGLGIEQLESAIKLKPDYWPPYAALSDHYKQIGDVGRARELLERGIQLAPNAKGLKSRLAELDRPTSKAGTKR